MSSQDPAIATAGLTRRFGELLAVRSLDLQVPRGSVYGFLGPNGAGKTTTIRMLLGLIRPDAGEVCLFGEPMRRRRMALLGRVGALVEAPSLYPHLTGRENLEVTRRLVGGDLRRIKRALALVRLEQEAHRRVSEYSQGMRQRLGLALALLHEPELLILDEPTNGLDPAGIHEMRDLMSHLPQEQGITVFLSSHLLSEVEQIATHIGIVRHGRMVYQGTLAELRTRMEEHVSLEVDEPQQAQAILRLAGWKVQHRGRQQLFVAANGPSDVALINAQLVHGGINVYHLDRSTLSLEDIFLRLTETQPA
jgi:lantibiotic transport system ATP-binding protein